MNLRSQCVARRLLGALALALVASPAVPAELVVERLEMTAPRPFGYVIGDLLEQRIALELASPYRLDEAALPQPGRLDRWLELRRSSARSARRGANTVYEIELLYQVFNIASGPTAVVVPSRRLRARGGGRTETIELPAWTFTVTPIRAAPSRAGMTDLRPERAPAPLPTPLHLERVAWLSAGLLAVLAWLAHAYGGLPLTRRRDRPFARACREIRRLGFGPAATASYLPALRQLHEAFNRTAGRAVFAEDLERFFREHPQFTAARASIEALFDRSRRVFFTGEAAEPEAGALAELARLCRRCRALERAAR